MIWYTNVFSTLFKRASITSAGYARVQAARNVRMRQAQNRFGRFMRRGGPRDSLD